MWEGCQTSSQGTFPFNSACPKEVTGSQMMDRQHWEATPGFMIVLRGPESLLHHHLHQREERTTETRMRMRDKLREGDATPHPDPPILTIISESQPYD